MLKYALQSNSANFHKEYDVYLFTPTTQGVENGQPWSMNFVNITDTSSTTKENNYDIFAYFGSEASPQKILDIRNAVSKYTAQTKFLDSTRQSEDFTPLNKETFEKEARKIFTSKQYGTYRLYIAKDNSQAFVVEFSQVIP